MRNIFNVVLLNIGFALAYFLGGYLGTLLAVPPSNASPIWPAAGIALAAIYIYRSEVLVGIFLGALAAQIYAFMDAPISFEKTWITLAVGGLTSLGGCLQAWFGVWLIDRFVGQNDPLIQDKKIVRFILLAGPVGCLISPSIGIATLYLRDIIHAGDIISGWLTWWAGDAIGVVIFAPLVLLFFAEPKTLWKNRRRYVVYPMLASLGLVFFAFHYTQQQEAQRIEALFEQQVNLLQTAINNELQQHVRLNVALKALFDSSSEVNRNEFHTFASALLKHHPQARALEWTPRINAQQRHELEVAESFVIRQANARGDMVRAAQRSDYFPIYFVEPVIGNEKAHGFDISTNPEVKRVIDKAIDSGTTQATGGIRLIQDDIGSNDGVVLYSPVYRKNAPIADAAQRERSFTGFAASVLKVGEEIEEALMSLPGVKLLLAIDDAQQRLYSNIPLSVGSNLNFSPLMHSERIDFAGRTWTIQYQPSPSFYHDQQSWTVWWILLGGFLWCSATGMGLLLLTGKTVGIEELVKVKTQDLLKTNAHLNFEIAARRQLEIEQTIRNQVLESLAVGDSLTVILKFVTLGAERLDPQSLCSILLLDERNQCLSVGSAPSLPDFYNEAVEGLAIGPAVGCCGTAAHTKQTVIVEDILNHPYWQAYTDLVMKTRLRACWSEPILAPDGRVLGTFAIYYRHPCTPTQESRRFIKNMAQLTAIAIETKRHEQEQRIAATTFQSHEAILVTDHEGTILRVNKAFTTVTGYSSEEAIGRNPRILASGMHDASFYAAMYRSLFETGQWQGEIWNRRKNGDVFPEWLTLTVVKNKQGDVMNYVGIFSDVSDKKAAEKEIHDLAFFDPLTTLPNRRLLLDRLHQEMAAAKRQQLFGSLFFLDLDRFKTLNDSRGHQVGDQLLIQVAQRLKKLVRHEDTACRLGGDEFIVLVPARETTLQHAADHAALLAEKILTAIDQPFTVQGSEHHFSTSIGVTLYPETTDIPEAVIQQADTAMYRAKEAGRNTISFFRPAMQELADKRLTLEKELRQAIHERQFILYYQAQVDNHGKVLSAETLIRWRHPQRGMVSPLEFIPVAEETQLILAIGQWVLNDVCRQIQAWDRQGHVIDHVAVNVSSKQFRQTDFVDQVAEALSLAGLTANRLMIELTEGSVVENIEDTIAKMQALQEMGVAISIDDFGTGYSSLSYLKKLPLSQLKVDQSFVRDIITDPSDAVIVETIINMAKNLGLNVVAEGVETLQQMQFLFAKGCNCYQGYYFAKPVPAADFSFTSLHQPGLLELDNPT